MSKSESAESRLESEGSVVETTRAPVSLKRWAAQQERDESGRDGPVGDEASATVASLQEGPSERDEAVDRDARAPVASLEEMDRVASAKKPRPVAGAPVALGDEQAEPEQAEPSVSAASVTMAEGQQEAAEGDQARPSKVPKVEVPGSEVGRDVAAVAPSAEGAEKKDELLPTTSHPSRYH